MKLSAYSKRFGAWIFGFILCLLPMWAQALSAPKAPTTSSSSNTTLQTPATNTKQKIIIDTDMAIDDWLAILYLLNHPGADVIGITVTGTGEARCKPGMTNALKMVELAGKKDIPVACGREKVDKFGTTFPLQWRNQVDALLDLPLPEPKGKPLNMKAEELLIKLAKEHHKPKLLTLGPLTNVADALKLDPTFKDKIQHTYIMGGSLYAMGNVHVADPSHSNKVSEWNIYVDPNSLDKVLRSGMPLTIVSLDATDKVPLDVAFYERVQHDHKTPTAKFIYDILTKQNEFVHSQGWYFWDPLAAAVALDNTMATIEHHKVSVMLEPRDRAGQTVISNDGVLVGVTVDADPKRFHDHFIDVINGRFS